MERKIKNEENLKNKIIIPYLKDLGLDEGNLHFELNFQIHIGKNPQIVSSSKEDIARGRLDILVKRNDVNLFVLEVKEPTHFITEDDVRQGISYASILFPQQAPFTIITNGTITRIFETATRDELTDKKLNESNFFKNGYRISFNPELRYEAFKHLIELDPENLLTFCKRQVEDRLLPLKSKIYKPEMIIERTSTSFFVDSFLNSEQNVLLITGNSGVGKTNFLCSLSEKLLESHGYVMFFSATMMSKDLETNLIEDFNWELNHNKNVIQYVRDLSFILNRVKKDLIICIDAIDEYPRENANIELNDFIRHVKDYPIKFIMTCKTTKADKFLSILGLPTYIPSIEKNNNAGSQSISNGNVLGDFTDYELVDAVGKYNEFYGTKAFPYDPIFKKLKNPFMLSLYFENYAQPSDKTVENFSYHLLISNYINKIFKDNDTRSICIECLTTITRNMLSQNKDKLYEQDLSPSFYDSIKLLSEVNIITVIKDEKNRRQLFFASDDIRKYITCYHLLKFDVIPASELKSIMDQYKNNLFVSEILVWYRKEEKNEEKSKILQENLFELYKQLGMQIISKYKEIVMNNFPFLKSKKGIVLFYDSETLSIFGYSFKDIDDGEEPVILLTGGFFTPEVRKHRLSVFRRVYGYLFEDLSFIDETKDYIMSEVKSHISNQSLDESDNAGLLRERLFDILYILFINKLFPSNPYEIVSGSWVFFRMTIDSIINSSRLVPSSLLEAKVIVHFLEQKGSTVLGPLLPLGDKITIGKSSMSIVKNGKLIDYEWIDPIIYKDYFYSNEKLIEFIRSYYNNFFVEYKILIDKNFPNHKKNFELYNNFPCHLVCEIEEIPNIYGGDHSTRILEMSIFKDNLVSNEIEITMKKGDSLFNESDFTVATKNGIIKLENWIEWGTKSENTLFRSKGKNNQILREFLYAYIEEELKRNPLQV